jgi:putative phosphoribosyl transferase
VACAAAPRTGYAAGVVATIERTVRIPVGQVSLEADFALPPSIRGTVVFAHGSGSSRHSSRNRYVARVLQEAGLATVLADLLTADEEEADRVTRQHRFDIGLLADRIVALVDWLAGQEPLAGVPLGLFGASTGAAAALIAASARPDAVAAVVSRGGRPDLAGAALESVRPPTLLIVGGRDDAVLGLNRRAMRALRGRVELEIVPGATHLFEEPGALEQVARLARDWFVRQR